MRFAHPEHAWLLLLVPLLVLFSLWAARRDRRDLARFASLETVTRLTRNVSRSRQHWKVALSIAGVLFLAVALMGPQFGVRLEMAQQRGVDVVFVLDLSRSMLAEDVRPSRLERARHLIAEILEGLEGDRVGLVVFAANAFTQCPLTFDHGAVRTLLDAVDAGSMPSQGTSLGRALETAGRALHDQERQDRVVVVVSDGETHDTDAAEAAARLAAAGARLYCLGVGTPDGGLIPRRADDGTRLEYHKDRRGNYVKTRLDEARLRAVAAAGEGAYWRTSLRGAEVDQLLDRIAGTEKHELGEKRFRRYEERFQIPLLAALACFLAEALLPERVRRRGAWRGRFA